MSICSGDGVCNGGVTRVIGRPVKVSSLSFIADSWCTAGDDDVKRVTVAGQNERVTNWLAEATIPGGWRESREKGGCR